MAYCICRCLALYDTIIGACLIVKAHSRIRTLVGPHYPHIVSMSILGHQHYCNMITVFALVECDALSLESPMEPPRHELSPSYAAGIKGAWLPLALKLMLTRGSAEKASTITSSPS